MNTRSEFGFLSQREKEFPAMVVMEITNTCNLECVHCPYVFISKRKDYLPRHMSWELYKKIAEEVSLHKGVLFRFVCDGEPTMHPRFLDMIKFAKTKGISPVNFVTNGTLLNDEMAKE